MRNYVDVGTPFTENQINPPWLPGSPSSSLNPELLTGRESRWLEALCPSLIVIVM